MTDHPRHISYEVSAVVGVCEGCVEALREPPGDRPIACYSVYGHTLDFETRNMLADCLSDHETLEAALDEARRLARRDGANVLVFDVWSGLGYYTIHPFSP